MATVFLILVYSTFGIGEIREIVGRYLDLVRPGWPMASEPGASHDRHDLSQSLTGGPPWEIPAMVGSMYVFACVGSLLSLLLPATAFGCSHAGSCLNAACITWRI